MAQATGNNPIQANIKAANQPRANEQNQRSNAVKPLENKSARKTQANQGRAVAEARAEQKPKTNAAEQRRSPAAVQTQKGQNVNSRV